METKSKILFECKKNITVLKSVIARKYGLASSTLFTILKNKAKLKEAALWKNTPVKSMKLRNGEHADLEEALCMWFCQKLPVSGPMLRAKANKFMK